MRIISALGSMSSKATTVRSSRQPRWRQRPRIASWGVRQFVLLIHHPEASFRVLLKARAAGLSEICMHISDKLRQLLSRRQVLHRRPHGAASRSGAQQPGGRLKESGRRSRSVPPRVARLLRARPCWRCAPPAARGRVPQCSAAKSGAQAPWSLLICWPA